MLEGLLFTLGGSTAVPPGVPAPDATTYGSLTLQTAVVYQGPNGSAGYDAIGDVVSYQYRDGTGRVDQYAVTYIRKDGYLQSTTSGQNISGTPNVRPATDESVYDNRGDLVAIAQHTQYAGGSLADTVRVFAYDGNGEIIERKDGTANGSLIDQGSTPAHENQHYVYVEGQQVAHYDEGGTLDVLDEVTAFSNSDSGAGGYVIQAGDTLKSMAQEIYGNASLWYVIADANAISGDSDLAIGQRLTIPEVTTDSNDSTTFKPYNPGSITGSTTPNLPTIAPPPPPPPPSGSGCNVIAEIIVIAVTIVVTYFTAGATSGLLADEFASAVASGAIAGAAGSIAGQLAGDALGVHQGLDWGQVAEGALAGGVTGGVTEGLQSTSAFTVAGEVDSAGNPVLNGWGQLLQGAGAYAGNAVAGEITGQPEHFSWAGLVASGISSVASGQLGPTPADQQIGQQGTNYLENIGAKAVGDVVGREASVGLGDNRVQSWEQVGEDVFGNALANAAIAGINAVRNYQANQLPEIDVPAAPVVIPGVQLQVSNIPQVIGPLEYPVSEGDTYDQGIQGAAPVGSSAGESSASPSASPLPEDATTYNNIPITNLPGPTVTPYDDPNVQPHFYTPEENARFSANLQQEQDDDRMRAEAVAVNQRRNQGAQIQQNRQAEADATVSRDGLTILTAPVVGAIGIAKGLVNTARTVLVEGQRVDDYISAKEAQLGTDVFGTADDQADADQLVQATRAELTQSIDPVFELSNPVERAGDQGFAAVGLFEGAATLVAKAPEIVNGVRGLVETLGDALSGTRAAEAAPEVAMEAAEVLPPPNVPVLPDAVDTAMTAAEAEPVATPVAVAASESASSIALDGGEVFAPNTGRADVVLSEQVSEAADSVASSEGATAGDAADGALDVSNEARLGEFNPESESGVDVSNDVVFNSGGDRLIESMGSARINNSAELKGIVEDLNENGVDIRYSTNEFAYGPASKAGQPGNIVIDPDASISSIRHEYGHFKDDQALGFPGQRFYYENPQLRVATERSQYLGEIRTARQLGDTGARQSLIQDYLGERQYLIDNYYFTPDGERIPYGGSYGK